jgi:CCR4-NOT transcription complex subunit 6
MFAHVLKAFERARAAQMAQSADEPLPGRIWLPRSCTRDQEASFTILSYNILADCYCTHRHFPYCDERWLRWDYRRKLITAELLKLNADIVCLQELEHSSFEHELAPHMRLHGYEGAFACKRNGALDGCGCFFRTERLRLLSSEDVHFASLCPMPLSNVRDNTRRASFWHTLTSLSNVAQLLHFQLRDTETTFIVCNCHLYWDPRFPDVKAAQAQILMWVLSQRRAYTESHTGLPCILVGDFNSLPEKHEGDQFDEITCSEGLVSGVYSLIRDGVLRTSHPHHPVTRRGLSQQPSEESSSTECDGRIWDLTDFTHDCPLSSAYAQVHRQVGADGLEIVGQQTFESRFTNYTKTFNGTLDYIFYSSDSLSPVQVLSLLPESFVKETALPTQHFPSDHLPIMARFVLAPDIDAT